ncbi:MAG: hypothetical protein JRI44_11255 [Deltaproteobacteria bacterium]|nr:hypothetical protein [Deltaproteobacteria bacterium]
MRIIFNIFLIFIFVLINKGLVLARVSGVCLQMMNVVKENNLPTIYHFGSGRFDKNKEDQ